MLILAFLLEIFIVSICIAGWVCGAMATWMRKKWWIMFLTALFPPIGLFFFASASRDYNWKQSDSDQFIHR